MNFIIFMDINIQIDMTWNLCALSFDVAMVELA